MDFRKCIIGGRRYGSGATDISAAAGARKAALASPVRGERGHALVFPNGRSLARGPSQGGQARFQRQSSISGEIQADPAGASRVPRVFLRRFLTDRAWRWRRDCQPRQLQRACCAVGADQEVRMSAAPLRSHAGADTREHRDRRNAERKSHPQEAEEVGVNREVALPTARAHHACLPVLAVPPGSGPVQHRLPHARGQRICDAARQVRPRSCP
jgi:hypothetical protein